MRSGLFVFIVAAALLAGGAGRLVWLERTRGPLLRQQAQRQHTATVPITARRGDILDARGRVLAGSIRRPSIFVDATMVEDPRLAAYSIAPVLGLNPGEVEKLLVEKRERGFVWVKRLVSEEQLARFEEIRRTRRLEAFGVQQEPQRVYPSERTAAQVLGFVGAEQHGLAGVEQSFDAILAGRDGRRTATVDVRRRQIRSDSDEYVAPVDGANVVLTLDTHIQQRAEYHLREAVTQYKATWGAAVVMDPQSGEILAMAVCPDFDPDDPFPAGLSDKQRETAQEHVRNRAISDSYEPGSIYKPFIGGPAVDEKLTRLDEMYAIHGPTHQFGGRTIHDTHAYDTLAFWEVISKSSNIGMGMLAMRLGNERLYRYVRSFGFGDPTGIDLPGEHPGLVQDFSRWGPFSTQSIPIGQEIAVTPLQVLTAFCVFCNDGVLYRPRIVRGVIASDGKTLHDWSRSVPVRRVLSPETVRSFREKALAEVVLSGTGKKAAIADYQVFGKTGTAQVARLGGGGYLPGAYVGSFVGGAPLVEPRATVIVSLYMPTSGQYYGGTVAAPTAGAILADTLVYMQVPAAPPPPQSAGGATGD